MNLNLTALFWPSDKFGLKLISKRSLGCFFSFGFFLIKLTDFGFDISLDFMGNKLNISTTVNKIYNDCTVVS